MKYELIYIEIKLKYCGNVYGAAPCTASGTGDEKCFNTRNNSHDCQDIANFTNSTKTIRFGLRDCGHLPADIDCIPLLKSARVTDGRINPAEDYGTRSVLNCSFYNGRHSDTGFDPYVSERSYIAFENGTFWGKFRARNTYLEGSEIKIYEGFLGQSLSEMDCRTFYIDKMDGPNSSGEVTIKASDLLVLLNAEKSLAPLQSTGVLSSDYSAGASSVTLSPAGVGDAEYPSFGRIALGREIYNFARSVGSDVFGITPSLITDHNEGEVAQQTLFYAPQNPGLIAAHLIENFTPLDSSNTDGATWAARIAEVDSSNYSREIVKPTPVRTLLNELIQQVGLVAKADPYLNVIDIDILRPNPVTGQLVDEYIIQENSFEQSEQPEKRFDNVIVYYDKRDTFSTDEPTAYYSAVAYIVPEPLYPTINNKIIYSQWIPSGGYNAARAVAKRAAARYQFPPRKFEFKLFTDEKRQLGEIFNITHPCIENAFGAQDSIRVITTKANPATDYNSYEAEEYNIDATLYEGDIIIPVDYDRYNLNLRDEYNINRSTIDTSPSAPAIIFIVRTGVVVGSTSTALPAITTGSWPSGVVPVLRVEAGAYIVGRGGDGMLDSNGMDGGDALNVTVDLDVENYGTIGGGGGGGGGLFDLIGPNGTARGGGGAGQSVGVGANNGTLTVGGAGGFGNSSEEAGAGGGLGQAGYAASIYPSGGTSFDGGAAGNAIVGVSLVTFINTGTILGAQIG